MSEKASTHAGRQKIQRLLARIPVIAGACELDLLLFFHRHPRTLVTSEQLATLVGYEMKHIVKSVDVFINAGLLERTQNPIHAARMYVLVLEGPEGGSIKEILDLASTRQGRREILQYLAPGKPDLRQSRRRIRAIA
jgi:hypothetical protein